MAKDETVRFSHRYCAHLSNAECIENGRLMYLQVDVQDTCAPTETEAVRALDASLDAWRRAHPATGG